MHPRRTLWISAERRLEGPGGLDELWVWTELSTRRLPTDASAKSAGLQEPGSRPDIWTQPRINQESVSQK